MADDDPGLRRGGSGSASALHDVGRYCDGAAAIARLRSARPLVCAVVALAGCSEPEQPAAPPRPFEVPAYTTATRVFYPQRHPASIAIPGGTKPVASLLNIRKSMAYGDFAWDERKVPPGETWVRVDLARQMLSVFRGAHEIGTAVILYGADGKPTPVGRFHVLARLRNHRSSLYDAPMPYTMRLTGDGVAIHGSDVREGAATHGCVGVPTDFARHLFDAIRVGTLVTIA